MTRPFLFISAALSVILIAIAFFIEDALVPGMVLLVVGVGWIVGLRFHLAWTSVIGLFVAYGFAVVGFFIDLTPVLLILGASCAFLAWDLTDFWQRLHLAAPEDDLAGLERRHFTRLGIVALAGLILVFAALSLQVKFTFEWAVVLVLLAVWGIGRVIGRLLR